MLIQGKEYELEELISLIQSKIEEKENEVSTFLDYENKYNGIYDILDKTKYKSSKANNKLVHNFAKKIVDDFTSFFMGFNVTITTTKGNDNNAIADLLNETNFLNLLYILSRDSAIFGISYMGCFLDEEGDLKLLRIHPSNVILQQNMFNQSLYAIIWSEETDYLTGDTIKNIYMYNDEEILEFIEIDGKMELKEDGQRENKFGKIPVIKFQNNFDESSEIRDIITLIDAYNLLQSISLDEFEELKKAYLVFKNVVLDDITYENMNEANIITIMEEAGIPASVSYLTKNADNSSLETTLKRIREDIHSISGIPDFGSASFSESRIIGIQAKLQGILNKTKTKENLYITSIKYFFKLVSFYLQFKFNTEVDVNDIIITFHRPLFSNLQEEVETAILMKSLGMISADTILNNLSIINNSQVEIEKYLQEMKEKPILYSLTETTEETTEEIDDTTEVVADNGEIIQETIDNM